VDDSLPVDIVVVAYQSAQHLKRCLASAGRQVASITVVDNASRDESADIAQQLGAAVIRNPTNMGFSAAANLGAATGEARYILFLNPDASLEHRDLSLLVARLDDDPELAVVAPSLVDEDGVPEPAWWPFPSFRLTWAEATGLHFLRRRGPDTPGDVPFVPGACMLVRREDFERLAGFDEQFWLYGEDADFCRRIWNTGRLVQFAPETSAIHSRGGSSHETAGLAFEHFQRGAELYIRKWEGRRALVLHRCGVLIGSGVRLAPLALRGPSGRQRMQRRWLAVRRSIRVLSSTPTKVPR
jgi:N-acetylglucosaminyl-diphospho-decaprenol L-rhamnosyltransferase